jgi:hypothetical protein
MAWHGETMRVGAIALGLTAACSAPSRLVGSLGGEGSGPGGGDSSGSFPGPDFWDYAACPSPVVADVSATVDGIVTGEGGRWTLPCTVTAVSGDATEDTAVLSCDDGGEAVVVTIVLGNAVVHLSEVLVVDTAVTYDLVTAAGETWGLWFTLRQDDVLRVAAVEAEHAVPNLPGAGTLVDFFAPLRLELEGGHCPPDQGTCFELGEPAGLMVHHDAVEQATVVLPRQSDTIEGYSIHAGESWLSIESEYTCDGASDDRVMAAFGAL